MVQQNQQIEIRSDRLPFSEMTILRRSLARSFAHTYADDC